MDRLTLKTYPLPEVCCLNCEHVRADYDGAWCNLMCDSDLKQDCSVCALTNYCDNFNKKEN